MVKSFNYDLSEKGLRAILRDYQEEALRVLWESKVPLTTKEVWEKVNARRSEPISRASIIFFLEDMMNAGVLKGDDRTGKGGHYYAYSPCMDEAEFKRFIALEVLGSLMKQFPEETESALKSIVVKD